MAAARQTKKDIYLLNNTLLCLVKPLEGKNITIDLRNDTCVCGTISEVDGLMNIMLTNVIYCDPRGNEYKFDQLFVHSRNIRYVHIPQSLPIIPAIKEALIRKPRRTNEDEDSNVKKSRKNRKALAQHLDTVASL